MLDLSKTVEMSVFREMVIRENKRQDILEESIWIIVHAMWAVEAESATNESWYLPYLKLLNTLRHLCEQKYLGEKYG